MPALRFCFFGLFVLAGIACRDDSALVFTRLLITSDNDPPKLVRSHGRTSFKDSASSRYQSAISGYTGLDVRRIHVTSAARS